MAPTTRSHTASSKRTHKLAILIVAIGALVLILQTQGDKLRHDWSPVGIGVKLLLAGVVLALLYYPYELFMKGPDAVREAIA